MLYRQRAHPRDVLINLMWGDLPPNRARSCLNTALWRLRQCLEPQGIPSGTYLISTSSGELCFNNESSYWLDVAAFENTVESALRTPAGQTSDLEINRLEKAVTLYTGDLLESNYSDWILPERERLRNLLLDAHHHLMCHYHDQRDFHRAMEHGSQILTYNPLREDVHRQMMRLYNDTGQRSLAVRQFQICRQALYDELNIEPMPETLALLDQIVGGVESAPPQQKNKTQVSEVHTALVRLQKALDEASQAARELGQALDSQE